jgi:hypothetical protein
MEDGHYPIYRCSQKNDTIPNPMFKNLQKRNAKALNTVRYSYIFSPNLPPCPLSGEYAIPVWCMAGEV